VTAHIFEVLAAIGPEVARIYVVDDACPEESGKRVESTCSDPRVTVLFHAQNQGVGGAVITGYRQALADGMDVVVKIDGDGQMDPALLPCFALPILEGQADYTKGNRFHNPEGVVKMPLVRLLGNAGLSFVAKFSAGYWDVFDPTNGYTAIHARVLEELPLDKISKRYFFESDMLFRLNIHRAVVLDIPMRAVYGDERSNLQIARVAPEIFVKNLRNLGKRIVYNYFLRDTSAASFELLVGGGLALFGVIYGAVAWSRSVAIGVPASSGTVMLAALPTILGVQLLLAFIAHDVASVPRIPLSGRLRRKTVVTQTGEQGV